MLIHPTMSMDLAKARQDDLIREAHAHARRPRHTRSPGGNAQAAPHSAGLGRLLGQALRRVQRTRAAEPAA